MKFVKVVIPFLFLFFFSTALKSQIIVSLIFGEALNSEKLQFGIEVGANATNITNFSLSSAAAGFEISMFLNWRYSEKWSLYSNLVANSNRGYRGDESMLDPNYLPGNDYEFWYMKERLAYGAAQSAFRYHISPAWSVAGGISLGLRFKAKDEGYYKNGDSSLEIGYKVNDDYRWLDAGPTLAVLYQFRQGYGASIIARGYYGVVDVAKEIPGYQSNYYFQLTAGILIGAKKGKDVAQEINPDE